MTATCVQHTTNPTTVDVCVSFFLPTDARHWIPSGTADVTLTVDAIELEKTSSPPPSSLQSSGARQPTGRGLSGGASGRTDQHREGATPPTDQQS